MKIVAFDPLNVIHVEYFRVMKMTISSDTRGIVAMDEKNKPMGMILFDNWTPNMVFGHILVTNPMCLRENGLVYEAVNYIYNVAGREFIVAPIRSNNLKAIELVKKIGFVEDYRFKDGYEPGVDLVMMKMSREQCNMIKRAA